VHNNNINYLSILFNRGIIYELETADLTDFEWVITVAKENIYTYNIIQKWRWVLYF
jgi:hypothetical protein